MSGGRWYRPGMQRTHMLGLALALSLSTLAGAGLAREQRDDHNVARGAVQRGEVMPIARILPLVAQYLPGDIVEIKLDENDNYDNLLCYEIKVLTQSGRVGEVVLDARTGALVEFRR